MKLKTIRIYPSMWSLDVVIGGNKKQLQELSEKRYGLNNDTIAHKECISIDSGKFSELKGERRVVICLKNLTDKTTLVHELIHALWHIARYIGYNMNYDTQEWQAILYEYLYIEVIDKKGYEEIK